MRDPNWTDEEVACCWKRDAPPKVQEDSKLVVLRTRYYLIPTNAGKGTAKSFGEKLDENYEIIRGVYPFEDAPPAPPAGVLLHHDSSSTTTVRTGARQPQRDLRGHRHRDVYATYHQSANAPVHIHEATHQIFKPLGLGGGGSWFQRAASTCPSSRTT
ncbi:MAG: hypothetical protein R3E96_06580 [Planctomycetota bacterium]